MKAAVEFGCNDGILLEKLRDRGVKAVGVDYSENITAIARSKGLDVVTGTPNCADGELVTTGSPGTTITRTLQRGPSVAIAQ